MKYFIIQCACEDYFTVYVSVPQTIVMDLNYVMRETLQLQSNKGQSSRDFTPGITFSYFTVNPNPKPFFEEPPLFLFLFFSYEVNRIVFLDVHIALTCISDSIWSANTHRPPSYYHTAGNRHHNIVMSQSSVSPVSSHYTRIQLLKNKNNKHKREQKKTQIRNIQ